ncbi:MAG: Fic family protein, partial [Planctomycetes bacterium]|nr:Fic family protein [Planctomycetota bacterium]
MKVPKTPPDKKKLWEQIKKNPERFEAIFKASPSRLTKGKYIHWDKLQYYSPPKELSHEEWWLAIKQQRENLFKQLLLNDKNQKPFKHLITDDIIEILHKIDQSIATFNQIPEQIRQTETKNRYYVNTLIQEAFTSSQLEGATTTRLVAKEMIQTGRLPCDKSEQMILNNFSTMKRIEKLKDEPLSKELVFKIHQLITDKTLDDSSATGRFRRANEPIAVYDMYNEVMHEPPPANQLEDRMTAMCDFANGKGPDYFIHPVIRSIIL